MSGFTTGFFGKLPTHGDFITRELPSHFIDIWDNWLQLFVSSTQAQLGDDWLDIYLTSPIWRFVFSEGVVDEQHWAGIMLPSVDRVGRYFPFSIITALPTQQNPVAILCEANDWFEQLEDAALQALNGDLELETLLETINEVPLAENTNYQKNVDIYGGTQAVSPLLMRLDFEEQTLHSLLPGMMDALLKTSYASYSAWATRGSEYVEPCMFVARGLPVTSGVAAMLEGQWQEWGWPEPYSLNEIQAEQDVVDDE
ncbi:type VI secretion system protein ImpM [Alteromonadaceae bacterium 2753L.S.0a.02]|nr:type VI secretion system protein ImpM [Alteromonadaceae bacterium 2753L.S.0a.02]